MNRIVRFAVRLLVVLAASRAVTSQAATFVYVSVAGTEQVAQFELDLKTGALSNRVDLQVGGAPGCLAVSPDKQSMYAAIRSEGALMSLAIDPKTGQLKVRNSVSAGNSAYVTTDRQGQFLFSAYYQDGKVAVHRLNKNGTIEPNVLQTIPTAKNAHCLQTDLTNRFAFVPHTGPNCIFQFRLDADTGRLAANSPPRMNGADGAGPRHIFFHPEKPWAYTSDELGSSVTAYRLDTQTGTLTPIDTHGTLPDDFDQRNTCSDVEVTPDGKYVLVGNRGHDSIARFAIDATTGKLKPLGQTPTEKTPRSFNVDPSGSFVVAAGQGSGKLALYRLNSNTGDLARLYTLAVGARPSWVQIVRLDP